MTTRLVTQEVTKSPTRLATGLPIPLLLMPLETDLRLLRGVGSATLTRSTIKRFLNRDTGLITVAAVDEPAFEQNGILIEGASTNLLLRSEEFDVAPWGNIGTVTVTANQGVAPDGTTTMDKLVYSGDASRRQTAVVSGATAGKTVTFSVSLQALVGSAIEIQLVETGGASGAAQFSTKNVAITGTTARFEVTGTVVQNDRTGIEVRIRDNASADIELLAWGAQLEELPFASSYIKTVASAVTRTADNLSIDAANIPAPTADYSVSAKIDLIGDNDNNQFFWQVQGESVRQLILNQASGLPRYRHGATVLDGNALPFDSSIQKFVTTFSASDSRMKIFQDAIETATVIGTAVTGTNTGIQIGMGTGGNQLFGHIKNFRIDNAALTAAQVGALP